MFSRKNVPGTFRRTVLQTPWTSRTNQDGSSFHHGSVEPFQPSLFQPEGAFPKEQLAGALRNLTDRGVLIGTSFGRYEGRGRHDQVAVVKLGRPVPRSTDIVPPPSPQATPQQSDQKKDITVYITRTGKRYRRASCSSLRSASTPISLKDAKAAATRRHLTALERAELGAMESAPIGEHILYPAALNP
jgi:hypothetical protein